jgi:hypothetical protein
MRTPFRFTLQSARVVAFASILSSCSELKQSPTAVAPVVNALVVDPADGLSSNYPQIYAELDVSVSGEIMLPSPFTDPATGASISSIPFSTPATLVNVTSGWTPSARAILRVTGPDGPIVEPLPMSGVLRGSMVAQYDRNGTLASNTILGKQLDGPSPPEWFATHPVNAKLICATGWCRDSRSPDTQ